MSGHLAMSDEDFLKQPLPETVEAVPNPTPENPPVQEETPTPEAEAETPAPVVEDAPENTSEPEEKNDAEAEGTEGEAKPEGEKPADPAPAGSEPEKPKEETPAPALPDATALGAFYNKVMAPFKANGKTIELKSPEEAIQLMQMGANFTRKMQELAPKRKLITMLESANLDEDKLSYLIDLDKKDPEAIKKLIKDSGIDPLDIDTNTESAYREGSHKVSNEEVAFRTHLEELGSTDDGKETLVVINSDWDQTSKDMLWQHPEMMSVIHAQREVGIYTKITDEMNRLKTLGKLPPTKPFLEAYQEIGNQLDAAGAFNDLKEAKPPENTGPAVASEPAPTPVATRAAAPKPPVNNGDKADAASPSRSAPGKAKETVNFLSMSDEEFAKHSNFANRV